MFSVLLSVYLGGELLGDMVTLMFNFLRNCQNVFQRGASFYIPAIYITSNVKVSNFSTSLSALIIVCLLDRNYVGVKWCLIVDVDLSVF